MQPLGIMTPLTTTVRVVGFEYTAGFVITAAALPTPLPVPLIAFWSYNTPDAEPLPEPVPARIGISALVEPWVGSLVVIWRRKIQLISCVGEPLLMLIFVKLL